jgi:hypothetical protein
MSFPAFLHWVNDMKYDAKRHRINAWHHWYNFCEDQHLTIPSLIVSNNPAHLISDFLLYLLEGKVASSPARAAKSAAVFLLEQLLNISDLGHNRVVTSFTASTTSAPSSSKSRYRTIWDLDILLNHISLSPPLYLLSLDALMARTMALLMIYAMARPIEVLRAEHEEAVFSSDGQQLSIPTRRKTDKGKQGSNLTVFRLSDSRIFPVRC